MNESDERYSTAEDAIYDAFFVLLKEKELEKITVSVSTRRMTGICAGRIFLLSATIRRRIPSLPTCLRLREAMLSLRRL